MGRARRRTGASRVATVGLVLAALVVAACVRVAFAADSCPSQWTQTAVQPPGGGNPGAAGISFPSPQAGWLVGGLTDSYNHNHPLVEYWDGPAASWLPGTPVDPSGGGAADARLSDVVSFAATSNEPAEAWAVGYQGNPSGMLIEQWTGPDPAASWTLAQPLSPPRYATVLVATAGSARNDLWAVGYTRNGARDDAHIEHYDGQAWTTAAPAPISGAVGSALIGVAADSSDDAWAVGYQTDGYGYRELIEHYDGAAWSTVSGAPAPGTAYDILTAVAAVSPQDVWAVGYQGSGQGFAPLVLHYDGQAWSAIPNPGEFGLQDILLDVAVVAANGNVVAGGFSFDPQLDAYVPFSETWPESAPGQITLLPPTEQNGQPVGKLFAGLSIDPSNGEAWAAIAPPSVAETICLGGVASRRNRRRVATGTDSETVVRAASPRPSPATTGSQRHPHAPATMTGGLVVAKDVSAAAFAGGIPWTKTYGAAVADFAGPGSAGPDGYEDFELGRHGSAPLELWVSRGDGTFDRIDAGDFARADRHRCAWGDVGSPAAPVPDGLPDLFCAIGAGKGLGHKSNELWIQKPDGSFEPAPLDPTAYPDAAVMDPFGRGRAPVFFYAGDAAAPPPHPLSLFLGEDAARKDGLPDPNRLFLNENGILVSSPASGLDREIGGACAQADDYDGDGYVDLLVCTTADGGAGLALYHNDGPTGPGGVPQFSDATATAGIQAKGAKFGLLTDLDGDGCADLVVVYAQRLDVDLQDSSDGSCLGNFRTAWTRSLAAGYSVAAGDVNGDGAPDLYVMQSQPTPDLMLINDGTGTGFSSVPIPQTAAGQAGGVFAIRDAVTGASDFLVLDGGHSAAGPVRLVRFAPNPTPDPLAITAAPPAQTFSTQATFAFESTQTDVTFVCSLDGADPVSCTSPVSYAGLAAAGHAFAVWSVQSSGDVSAEAKHDWSVLEDHAPMAQDGSVQTGADTPVSGHVLANDPDPGQTLRYTAVTRPTHGALQLDAATGAFTYSPNAGFFGSDAFTFSANDGYLSSNVATESVSVSAPPPATGTGSGGSAGTGSANGGGSGGGSSSPLVLLLLALAAARAGKRPRRCRPGPARIRRKPAP